jgi:hypothetical protein
MSHSHLVSEHATSTQPLNLSFCLPRVNQSFVLLRLLLSPTQPSFFRVLFLAFTTAHHRHIGRIKANFKTEQNRTVAREFVYRQYQQFCIDQNIESTTQSAFGRILKDVFPGVRPTLSPGG